MPFEKDKMKKKDEEILDEMKQQIDEADELKKEAEADAAAANTEAESADAEADKDAEAEKDPAAEIEALNAKLAEGEERYKRLQADFENFRRRTRQEKEEISNVVMQEFMKALLPLIDNFDRAIAAEAKDAAAFQQGIEMIYNQLAELLKNRGLEAIDTTDVKFDPNFHQAVMRVENPELEDDTIAAELQRGYMVKGKVIRPAMVQVVAN